MAVAQFLTELKRRKVFRVALIYAGVAWLLLQFVDVVSQPLGLPDWSVTSVLLLSAVGFPLAIGVAWAYDLTPGGIERTEAESREHLHPPLTMSVALQMLLIAVLVISVGFLYLDRLRLQQESADTAQRMAAQLETTNSIAVLPFVDMSEAGDQQYFGDGIAEELLDALVRVEDLRVAARTSSFSFHGKDVGIAEIGTTLGVAYVLEGSVRRSGEQVRITAQLVDTRSGFHLFSQTYQRKLDDIFEIQNEIARKIVSALLPSLGVAETRDLVQQQTTNMEAYKLRMRGRYTFFRANRQALQEAISYIEQAIALDPQYWAAWGDLSYANGYMAFQTGDDPIPYLNRANHAASVALANDPTNVPGLLLRALVLTLYEFDHEAAAEYYQRALDSGDDYTYWAYNMAWLNLGPLGRLDEALGLLQKAEQQDPLASMPREAMTVMYQAAGRLEEAEAMASELLIMPGVSPSSRSMAGIALVQAGNMDLAAQVLSGLAAWTGPEHPSITLFRLRFHAAAGADDRVQQMLDQMLAWVEEGRFYSPSTIGDAYLESGEIEQALDWYSRALDMREPNFYSELGRNRQDPRLVSQPRFRALLGRMNLAGE